MAKVVTSVTATIAAGASLSDVADVRSGNAVMLLTPSAWDPANLSLQVSQDGITFSDLHDADGHEVHLPMGASRAFLMPPALLQPANYVRIRSGLAAHPIPQSSACTFSVVMV
jgi:hypothetical protein